MSQLADSIYIHIPFCSFACHYCDFSKTADQSAELLDNYFSVLSKDLGSRLGELAPKLKTVYFGGGTPGLFTDRLTRVLEYLSERVTSETEQTIEVNPNNLNPQSFAAWRAMGFNRFSVGVQSFDPVGLKVMTRDHNTQSTHSALSILSEAKVNWSLDLIYGWHGQSHKSWLKDLDAALAYKPPHISMYSLTYEAGTPYALQKRRGVLVEQDQEQAAQMYDDACTLLREHGYEHYELASFCRAGFASKHNSGYWDLGSCVAVGSGAHGFIAPQTKSSPGIRYGHAKDIRQYLAAWDKPAVDAERNVFDLILELGLVRLRTQKGIALSDIQKYLPADKAERFWGRIGGNQILGPQVEGEVLRLPEQQWLLENAYLRAFDQCLQEIR